MNWRILANLLIAYAVIFTPAQADGRKTIAIEVVLGKSYADVIGVDKAAAAKSEAEEALATVLGEAVRYFDFVPSTTAAPHQLSFRIAHPETEDPGRFENIHDYYVFLSLTSDGAPKGKTLHWLFRDATSSMYGVDTAETIAKALSREVAERQYERIIEELLNHMSFTENAKFSGERPRGWFLGYPRMDLCMKTNSLLKVLSVVPDQGYEDEYTAAVKKHINDTETTFSLPRDDVSDLVAKPEDARVVAVYVLHYEKDCPAAETVSENPPQAGNFGTGGGL